MPKKIVVYNGRTDSYYVCSNSRLLIVGEKYEVIAEKKKDYQTDYILDGIEGSFNSNWFSEVISFFPSTFIAVSNTIPCIGERYECLKIEKMNEKWKTRKCKTDTVQSVFKVGENIYQVITDISIYIVNVAEN